jgi:hypothetical protein
MVPHIVTGPVPPLPNTPPNNANVPTPITIKDTNNETIII